MTFRAPSLEEIDQQAQAASESIKNEMQSTLMDLKGMQKEIETLEKDVLSPVLNAETREKKTQELQSKRVEIKRFAEDAQKENIAVQQKEFEKIQADLMPIIEKIAKENGLSVILDLNTSGITYFEPSIDISEKVVKAYDAQSAAAAPAAKK